MTGSPRWSSDTRLRIHRLCAAGLAPAGDPASHRFGDLLATCIRRDLPDVLRAALPRSLASTGDGVWIVGSLEIEIDVDSSSDRCALAEALGGDTSRQLARVLITGEEGENVRWFADRADMLAAFLAELAGGGGRQWYFRSLHG